MEDLPKQHNGALSLVPSEERRLPEHDGGAEHGLPDEQDGDHAGQRGERLVAEEPPDVARGLETADERRKEPDGDGVEGGEDCREQSRHNDLATRLRFEARPRSPGDP